MDGIEQMSRPPSSPATAHPFRHRERPAAVGPDTNARLGTALSEMSRKIGLTNSDVVAIEQGPDTRAAEPLDFKGNYVQELTLHWVRHSGSSPV